MLIMPTRPRWATLRIESAELEPAFMVGDVCLFDPDQPVHEATPLDGRVVVLTADGVLRAGLARAGAVTIGNGETISRPACLWMEDISRWLENPGNRVQMK